jgi:hypothetical protein
MFTGGQAPARDSAFAMRALVMDEPWAILCRHRLEPRLEGMAQTSSAKTTIGLRCSEFTALQPFRGTGREA